jgi:glycerol kinase
MTHLLAIDQGTTSTRAIVFDAALAPLASAQQLFVKAGQIRHILISNRSDAESGAALTRFEPCMLAEARKASGNSAAAASA